MPTETVSKTSEAQPDIARSPWMGLARGASVAMVIWAIALHATAGALVPPVAVIGVGYLVLVPFLRGRKRRLGLGLALFSVLVVVGNLPVVIDELAHPESAPAFILTLLAVTSASVAIVAGLAVFWDWSSKPVRKVALGSAVVVFTGAVMSSVVAAGTLSEQPLASDVVVVAEGIAWSQPDVVLEPEHSGVWVDNRDGVRHSFTLPELGVDLDIPALKGRRIDLSPPPGTYQIICTVPGHETMTGSLLVSDQER